MERDVKNISKTKIRKLCQINEKLQLDLKVVVYLVIVFKEWISNWNDLFSAHHFNNYSNSHQGNYLLRQAYNFILM